MRNHRLALCAILLLAGTAPVYAQSQPRAAEARPPQVSPGSAARQGQPRYGSFGLDLAARDVAVDPGDDFFRYANGTWLNATEIPADRTSWSLWTVLSEDIEQQLRAIVTDAAASTDPAQRKVGDFYAAWMDEAGIEARGTAPLHPYLQRIAGIGNRDQLLATFATPGFVSPVGVGIIPNLADPTRYTAVAGQGGLGMPNRDYYLREGAEYDRYRAAYRDYIVQLHTLAGIADGAARADRIIALERRIAEAHWTPERSRDIAAINNPMTRAQLMELAPQFEWETYLQRRGLGAAETVIATQTTAIQGIGRLLDEVPLDTWKEYLAFHFINSYANYLPRAFDEAKFNFFSRTIAGQEQQRDRWKRGLGLVNAALGEAVGRIYVERHFPAESRRQMDELITNLRTAFGERLRTLDWMDDETRAQALAKLDSFEPRIGHPEVWIDYSNYQVDRGDLLGNMVRAAEFGWNLQLSRFPNPVDRRLWGMNPQIINASYNPLMNQITFPAGILQAPFFDPNADPAVNYGAIGAVIGHEIGHGFDDQGRRFDPTGRVRDWWTAASAERFTERTTRLGQQYSQYSPLPGLNVNGQLTMGENIGDLGGLEMAYAAYRRHVAQHGEPPVLNGLTGDQRFFLSWAQVWRSKQREGATRQRVLTDPHSPDEYRVNGAVRNIDAWYRAFNVTPDDALYLPPEQRVHIW
ncbi:M13 family metallopeptidase [Sphingosinicella sp. YJ22]|uniref:M13 family metallopeptidase n=1 Tax=Sphingosinicella sp. YJ22 TaxID=1104780 RepID=UPI00140D64ED|nr:M13 family metallopeptidase [Sphingosinicella sp. YJ22]